MKTRKYLSKDCKIIVELFHDTIHSINSKDYTEAQLNAWSPKDNDLLEWDNKLTNNYSVVVEKDNTIVGFGTVTGTGYLDLLYVHKDYQGLGAATLIADEIEKYVYRKGAKIITTEASATAKTFFEKRGYSVLKKQSVERRGQYFTNFKMQKIL